MKLRWECKVKIRAAKQIIHPTFFYFTQLMLATKFISATLFQRQWKALVTGASIGSLEQKNSSKDEEGNGGNQKDNEKSRPLSAGLKN